MPNVLTCTNPMSSGRQITHGRPSFECEKYHCTCNCFSRLRDYHVKTSFNVPVYQVQENSFDQIIFKVKFKTALLTKYTLIAGAN